MWWNNVLVVLLALALLGFGHPIAAVVIVLCLWQLPSKKKDSEKGVTDDGFEYEVIDED